MYKLVYIYVPNEFVIGNVVLKLLIKRLAVVMVNKTVGLVARWDPYANMFLLEHLFTAEVQTKGRV
jgi:hypothetical protein